MLSNRLSQITPSYTIEISSKVMSLISDGHDVINFSIGEPNFSVPAAAKDAGKSSLDNDLTKYDKVPGTLDLRQAIAGKLFRENNIKYTIDEIIVTSGAKNAITNALLAILNDGDEVLVPKPYWVSYPEMIKLCGGVPVFLDTYVESGYKVTADIIKSSLTTRTKMIFLSNPSNPSGVVYSKEELEAIVSVCYENNIYILSDEIYERITFDQPFVSTASISAEAKEITITINGLSKSAAMTGLRIGYSASSKILSKGMATIQGHLISHPSTTAQWIATTALNDCNDDILLMKEAYQNRRDAAVNILNDIPQLSYANPQGAFYLFIDLSAYKSKFEWTDSFSIEFCNKLLEDKLVAVVPGIAFGMDDFIRISYACDMDSLIKGMNLFKDFLCD